MKLIHVLLLLALVVGGFFAWKKLPGFRTKVEDTVEEYGGWTEEARKSDPVGFLTYAEEKLERDIEAFQESRTKLSEAQKRGEEESERHAGLVAAASELAAAFRERFRDAEASNAWPIQFNGASYTREQFVEQVDSILAEKASSERVIEIYDEVAETALERDKELRARIQSTKATLQQLAAQKELVRVEKLTAEADELMVKVNELIGGNDTTLTEGEPVRSLEDLLSAAKNEPVETGSSDDVLDFLNADSPN